ncbi:unnamed protein product, partial [Brassica napus]
FGLVKKEQVSEVKSFGESTRIEGSDVTNRSSKRRQQSVSLLPPLVCSWWSQVSSLTSLL